MSGGNIISIIIPAYNREQFIGECLDSVINQTYENWEALVVDDGSVDKTVDIVKEYACKDSRVKLIERQSDPRGGAACRNIGAAKAQGDYIIFLDSDDLLAPWCIEGRLKIITENPNLDFAVFMTAEFVHGEPEKYKIFNKPIIDDPLSMFLRHEIPWQTTSLIWYKPFFIGLGGFREYYLRLQDVELHSRALLKNQVKYRICNNRLDSYFRRYSKPASNHLSVKNVAQAFIFYIQDIFPLVSQDENYFLAKRKYSLRLLFFKAFREYVVFYGGGLVDEGKMLIRVGRSCGLITKKEELLLKFYVATFGLRFYKIRGFD